MEDEVSDQTGPRSVRTRSHCASRNFPKQLAFAPLGILKVFVFVLYRLDQHSLLCWEGSTFKPICSPGRWNSQLSCWGAESTALLSSLFWPVESLSARTGGEMVSAPGTAGELTGCSVCCALVLSHRRFWRVNPSPTSEHKCTSSSLLQKTFRDCT